MLYEANTERVINSGHLKRTPRLNLSRPHSNEAPHVRAGPQCQMVDLAVIGAWGAGCPVSIDLDLLVADVFRDGLRVGDGLGA